MAITAGKPVVRKPALWAGQAVPYGQLWLLGASVVLFILTRGYMLHDFEPQISDIEYYWQRTVFFLRDGLMPVTVHAPFSYFALR